MEELQSKATSEQRSALSNFSASLLASVVVVLTAFSLKSYFFFVPFETGFNFLSLMATLTLIGWIILVTVPPILLAMRSKWNSRRTALLIVSASVWTFATTAIKVYGLAISGRLWADYLALYPIMIFVEWILPAAYVLLALSLQKQSKRSAAAASAAAATPQHH